MQERGIIKIKWIMIFIIYIASSNLFAQAPDTLWTRRFGGAKSKAFSISKTSDGGYIAAGDIYMNNLDTIDICLIKIDSIGNVQWKRSYGGKKDDHAYSIQQTSDGGYIIAGSTWSFGSGWYDVYLIKTNANGDTLWTRTYGGIVNDWGYSVQQTNDGGYIVTGGTYSFGSGALDIYLIKTDASGDIIWTRTFGGTKDDVGRSLQQTNDGGYTIAGWTNSFGGSYDVYLIRTDQNGDTLWSKTYGGPYDDYGWSVQQTTDGGFIVTGTGDVSSSSVYLIKTDSNGDTLWTRMYGGTNYDAGRSVQQSNDGGYIIAGWTNSFGGRYDVYLIRTDQNGDTLWTKIYGKDVFYEKGYSIQICSDSGYIIGGYSENIYGHNMYLVKTDLNGNTLWTRIYGNGENSEEAYSVKETTDSGLIIAGYTRSYGAGGADVYLIKTDVNGDKVWTKTYGGKYNDYAYGLQQTTDGGYIIVGHTTSFGAGRHDVYLIKTDANGDTLWTRTYGGTDWDIGYSVQQTSDGGYVITGKTYTYGLTSADVYIIKTDANGQALWTKSYGGKYDDFGYDVQQTSDGGYFVVGSTYSLSDMFDVYLIKTNANGDSLWSKTYGGVADDGACSIKNTSDGGYIMVGRTTSFGVGYYDVFLIKIDSNGHLLWADTYGGKNNEEGSSVDQTSDGGYIVTGYTNLPGYPDHDVYIIRTDTNGNRLWTKILGDEYEDFGYSAHQVSDGGYIIAGATYSQEKIFDVYLIRLAPEVGVEEEITKFANKIFLRTFPNPFNHQTNIEYFLLEDTEIEVAVFDAVGRKIKTIWVGNKEKGLHKTTWTGRDEQGKKLASGVYFLKFTAGEYEKTKKLLIMR